MTGAGGPDDVGQADPRLASALAAGNAAAVREALLVVRVLVPVLATGEDSHDAEMAVPRLVGADGRHALPVFSSYDALRGWRADARPVPMSGAHAVEAAVGEGYDAVLLDVAGPVPHVVAGDDLRVLAAAADALRSGAAGRVRVVPEGPVRW